MPATCDDKYAHCEGRLALRLPEDVTQEIIFEIQKGVKRLVGEFNGEGPPRVRSISGEEFTALFPEYGVEKSRLNSDGKGQPDKSSKKKRR